MDFVRRKPTRLDAEDGTQFYSSPYMRKWMPLKAAWWRSLGNTGGRGFGFWAPGSGGELALSGGTTGGGGEAGVHTCNR